MADRTWRIAADLRFPSEIPRAPDGGLPEKLEPLSRVIAQTVRIGSLTLALEPRDPPAGVPFNPNWTWAALVTEVRAEDSQPAIERGVGAMEGVVESMSFQLQAPLVLDSLTAVDVTPPVTPGEEREVWSYALGVGYPLRRYRRAAVQMAGIVTAREPVLAYDLSRLSDRQRACLDWYLKALAAQFQVDQFMFLWIATEILSDLSECSVERPYSGPCQHEIASCPRCGRPTTQKIRGASHRRFLTEGFGVDSVTARELWRARQIMHGAEHFDSSVMDRLAELSQVLRTVVNAALKAALGLGSDSPPFVEAGQLSITPYMALGGTAVVQGSDLTPPLPPG